MSDRSFRIPARALAADYARGGIGALVCIVAVLAIQPSPAVIAALSLAAGLFLVYFVRTVRRQLTRIELDDNGIRARGPEFLRLRVALRWEELRSLSLDYYSTRSDADWRTMQEGWMQLQLRDARRAIRIESDIDGFEALVRAAAEAAARRGLELDPATRANLAALGIASAVRYGADQA